MWDKVQIPGLPLPQVWDAAKGFPGAPGIELVDSFQVRLGELFPRVQNFDLAEK